MGLQMGLEDISGVCRGDVFRRTVSDSSSGDWKSSITSNRQSGVADNQ